MASAVVVSGDGVSDELSTRLVEMRDLLGFRPRGVIDVGANKGAWSRRVSEIFPEADVFMVEGSEERRQDLAATGLDFSINVLAAAPGPVTWYENEKYHTGNSIFKERTKFFAEPGTRAVVRNCTTLDVLLGEEKAGVRFDFLKVDAQGAELDVLRGASALLAGVELVMLELSIIDYNSGAPLAGEVIASMWNLGFGVFDVTEQHRSSTFGSQGSFLFQVDMLFIRADSPLLDKVMPDVMVSEQHRERRARAHNGRLPKT